MNSEYNNSIDKLLYNINENYKNWYGRKDNWHKKDLVLSVIIGRKFDKIVEDIGNAWQEAIPNGIINKNLSLIHI